MHINQQCDDWVCLKMVDTSTPFAHVWPSISGCPSFGCHVSTASTCHVVQKQLVSAMCVVMENMKIKMLYVKQE